MAATPLPVNHAKAQNILAGDINAIAQRVNDHDAGKLDEISAAAAADTTPNWRSVFSGTGFGTTVQNTFERMVPMKASAAVASFLTGWLNEWGAIRGTSPYTWGDALVRAIRQTGDGITAGNFAELSDRTVTPTLIRWARRWTDGGLVRNGIATRELYVWKTGDINPTTGTTVNTTVGTIPLPANCAFLLFMSSTDVRPAWAPDGLTLEIRGA